MKHDLPAEASSPQSKEFTRSESPGVPGCRTWRTLYVVVIASFIFYVALLVLFSWVFS